MTDGVDELNVLAIGFFLPVLLGSKYYGIGPQRPVYPIDRLLNLTVLLPSVRIESKKIGLQGIWG